MNDFEFLQLILQMNANEIAKFNGWLSFFGAIITSVVVASLAIWFQKMYDKWKEDQKLEKLKFNI